MANREPRTGPPETLAERLLAYVSQVDPSFAERCLPAHRDDIERYASLAGFQSEAALPASYRSFLNRMGEASGGILRNLEIEAELTAVLQLYEDYLRSEPESLNPELPVVGMYLLGSEISLDRRVPTGEPAVVDTGAGEYAGPLSRSWECFMMQTAMRWVLPRIHPCSWAFSSSSRDEASALARRGRTSVHEVFDAILARGEATSAWLSDERHRILLHPGGVMFAELGSCGGVVLYVFGANERFCIEVGGTLATELGANSRRPYILTREE